MADKTQKSKKKIVSVKNYQDFIKKHTQQTLLKKKSCKNYLSNLIKI